MWCLMPVNPNTKRWLSQEDCLEFMANPGYIVSSGPFGLRSKTLSPAITKKTTKTTEAQAVAHLAKCLCGTQSPEFNPQPKIAIDHTHLLAPQKWR